MNAGVPRYAPPIKFFKRKKRKKESHSSKWKVSKKQVFQKKYYPIRDWKRKRLIKREMCFETVWVEIFSETRRAWTCFFEYLELIFALFFLFFILNIQIKCSCLIGFYLKYWELIRKIDVFGKGIKFFLLVLIFEDAWKSVGSLSVQLAEKCLMKMWSIFKKQCIILPSAMWQ